MISNSRLSLAAIYSKTPPYFGQPWKKESLENFTCNSEGNDSRKIAVLSVNVLEYSGFCMNHVPSNFREFRPSFYDLFRLNQREPLLVNVLIGWSEYIFCLNVLCYFVGVRGYGKNERWHVGTYFVKCQGKAGRTMHKISHNTRKIRVLPSGKAMLFPSNLPQTPSPLCRRNLKT